MTDDYEPRQIREEAAVNNSICITKQSGPITFSYQKIIPFSVQRRMHGQGSQFSRTIHRDIPISIVKHQINPYNLDDLVKVKNIRIWSNALRPNY